MSKIKEVIYKKIVSYFDHTNYIKFFSKKSSLDFIFRKLRNAYLKALANNDLKPIKKMNKVFVSNDRKIEIFMDSHDYSHIGQVADPNWENKIFNYYDKFNFDNLIFVDLGANIGCHTLFYYNFKKFDKLIYVEPNLKCVELFRQSLSVQKSFKEKQDKVLILNNVIGDKNGYLDLKVFKNNSGSGTIVDYFGKESKKNIMLKSKSEFNFSKIETLTISNIFSKIKKNDNIIIKMDIQGAEPRILNQIGDIIDDYNVKLCFFEINDFDHDIMKKSLRKFKKKYFLNDLKDEQVDENNMNKYLKDVLVLKSKSIINHRD